MMKSYRAEGILNLSISLYEQVYSIAVRDSFLLGL